MRLRCPMTRGSLVVSTLSPSSHVAIVNRYGSQIVYCSPITHGPFSSLRSISSKQLSARWCCGYSVLGYDRPLSFEHSAYMSPHFSKTGGIRRKVQQRVSKKLSLARLDD